MSNYLAIASVTATLQNVLQEIIQLDVEGAIVTTVRPDSLGGSGMPERGINLYLYQVLPNPAWTNADLATRNSAGQFLKRPQAALDLFYLFNCYGNDIDLEPQRLLGSVVRTLHAQPYMSRQMIRDTITAPNYAYLADSDLPDQIEQIKVTPLSLSMEELSNLWSAFFQTPYVLSIAYQCGVVLIESDDIPQRALPIRDRRFGIMPRELIIEQVLSQAGKFEPISMDSTLLIRGKLLQGEVTQVRIGDFEVTPQEVKETQIRLQLSSMRSEWLRPGVQSLQVVHRARKRPSLTVEKSVESNVVAFVLRPTIINVEVSIDPNLELETEENVENDLRAALVTAQINPTVGALQRVVLVLNEVPENTQTETRQSSQPLIPSLQSPTSVTAYNFKAAPREVDTNSIIFAINDVKPGVYLVRVQVDGAESVLNVDRNSNSPTFEQYISPTVVIL